MSKKTGIKGEALAAQYLLEKGYRIVAGNWRWSRAEIDLIAEQEGVLCIVEVKTRSTAYFGHPAAFVSSRQKRFLWEAANMYLAENALECELRFDIISVLLYPNRPPLIEHFPDAFIP